MLTSSLFTITYYFAQANPSAMLVSLRMPAPLERGAAIGAHRVGHAPHRLKTENYSASHSAFAAEQRLRNAVSCTVQAPENCKLKTENYLTPLSTLQTPL